MQPEHRVVYQVRADEQELIPTDCTDRSLAPAMAGQPLRLRNDSGARSDTRLYDFRCNLNMDSKAECVSDSLMDSFAERRMGMNGLFQFFMRSLKIDRKTEFGD